MKENKRIILSVLGIIVLMILIVGTTYAGFSKTSSGGNNSISSGTITMSFQEPSNNVVITNAMPISGTGYSSTTHFDFSVTGTAKAAIPIAYEISITEKSGNTIDPQYVMIGLKKNGNVFYPSGVPASVLRSSSVRNGAKMLVKDQFTLAQSGSNYTATDNYQLFLWLASNYPMPSDGSNEAYSITVNVNSNVGAIGVTSAQTTKYVVSTTTMSMGSSLPNEDKNKAQKPADFPVHFGASFTSRSRWRPARAARRAAGSPAAGRDPRARTRPRSPRPRRCSSRSPPRRLPCRCWRGRPQRS